MGVSGVVGEVGEAGVRVGSACAGGELVKGASFVELGGAGGGARRGRGAGAGAAAGEARPWAAERRRARAARPGRVKAKPRRQTDKQTNS